MLKLNVTSALLAAAIVAGAFSNASARLVQADYVQDSQNKTCPPGGTCKLTFQGWGKNTIIEAVSCWINVSENSTVKPDLTRLQLNQSAVNGVHMFLGPLSVVSKRGGTTTYQVYASGLSYLVIPASKPEIIAEFNPSVPSPGVGLICAYTGRQLAE